MKPKRSIAQFENELEGMQGNIALYRRGINEFFLSQSFPLIYERLEAVRRDLESLGVYEVCRDALTQAEALVKQGAEHDEAARKLILNANRALMQASGSFDAMRHRYGSGNDNAGPPSGDAND